MASIELVYDAGCPKVENARRNAKLALKNLGLPASWTEWERSSPFASWARQFGSPTILVNRDPVPTTGSANPISNSPVQLEQTAVPSVKAIEMALARAMAREHAVVRSERAEAKKTNPFVLSLLPLFCCLPLILVVFSSVSLGSLLFADYSFPLVTSLFVVVLASLGFFARRDRRHEPHRRSSYECKTND